VEYVSVRAPDAHPSAGNSAGSELRRQGAYGPHASRAKLQALFHARGQRECRSTREYQGGGKEQAAHDRPHTEEPYMVRASRGTMRTPNRGWNGLRVRNQTPFPFMTFFS